MSDQVHVSRTGSEAVTSAATTVVSEGADQSTRALFDAILEATRSLKQAALCAVDSAVEAVSVATFCAAARHSSVELSLLKDSPQGKHRDFELLAENLNSAALNGLASIRRLGAHQCALIGSIEQAGTDLTLLADLLTRSEIGRAQESKRAMHEMHTQAQDVVQRAHALEQILNRAWPASRGNSK